MTERRRLQIQAAEKSFLYRVVGLSIRDGVKNSDIWEEFRLLLIERT